MRILSQREQYSWRVAAVNQDLVDRLRDEYHGWYADHGIEALNYAGRGPLGNWRNIENFMKDRYPAAHRGLNAGQESVGPLLDSTLDPENYDPQADPRGWGRDSSGRLVPTEGVKLYETGPDAVAQHGYDPSEIAAGMLLLHNQTHPFRGDMAQQDQDRLNDIAQKRTQMQQDYEQRTAAPKRKPHGPSADRQGDCYEAAAHHMLSGESNENTRLVHGEVAGQGPLEGKTFGHAWCEDGDWVTDKSNGRNLVMPKAQYYALGRIGDINNLHSYSRVDAVKKMLEHEHYGPWDLETEL